MRGVYYLPFSIDGVNAAKTLVQVCPLAGAQFELLRAQITQVNSVASEQLQFSFKIFTYANRGTVTALTPLNSLANDASTDVGTGYNATVEPTSPVTIYSECVNALAGLNYLPIPEERWIITRDACFGLSLDTVPVAPLNIRGVLVIRNQLAV